MTYAFAIICFVLYRRIQYLRGYIRGQKHGIKSLGETISRQAEIIDGKQASIDYLTELVLSQNEQIKDLQFDPQEFVDDILKDKK